MEHLLRHSINDHKIYKNDFLKFLDKELNLYNRGALVQKNIYPTKTDFEINEKSFVISFNLSGDLNGIIICSLQIPPSITNEETLREIQSFYTEAMNILLGKFLTNLEKHTNIMALLDSPKYINKEKLREVQKQNLNRNLSFYTNYDLIIPTLELPCKIYFSANKARTNKEV